MKTQLKGSRSYHKKRMWSLFYDKKPVEGFQLTDYNTCREKEEELGDNKKYKKLLFAILAKTR